jgi:hypothetical protein
MSPQSGIATQRFGYLGSQNLRVGSTWLIPERMYSHVNSLRGHQITDGKRLRYALMQKLDEKGK